MKDKEH